MVIQAFFENPIFGTCIPTYRPASINFKEKLDFALAAAINSNTGLIYVTDADMNENRWGRVPVYFDELVSHQTFQCNQG